MSLNVFLELVEIKAKTASILPMLLGMGLSIYYFAAVNIADSILFFIAMLLFNMAVDMLDNYHDYQHAVDTKDYQQNTNIIGRENISPRLVLGLLLLFSIIAAVIGLYLVTKVGLPLLWMGIFCFAIGILYSAGPFPLSALPVGELAAGFTMGFMITLITVYINTYQTFNWTWKNLVIIFLVALPDELWISNLLLANNICDADEDENNHRQTIIHFIGQRAGLQAFAVKNALAFIALLGVVLLKLAPWTVLLTLLIIPFVIKQTKMLFKKQVKQETFPCAVRILLVGSLTYVGTYTLGLLF